MKKVYAFIAILLLVGVIAACASSKGNNQVFSKESDQLSYQMLSGIKMLESADLFTPSTSSLSLSSAVAEVDEIEKYLSMMEELLNSNGGFSSEVLASDKPEYAHLMKIKTRDLSGNSAEYLMYYNETEVREEKDHDDDDDELEVTTKFSGIAVTSDATYTLEGVKQVETEIGESEEEMTFKIITDSSNYVIVSTETESEFNESENSFSYTLVQNGKRIHSVNFELEEENNELEIKLVEKSSSNSKKMYCFKIETINGIKYIKVRIQEGETTKVIHVKEVFNTETNIYSYEYSYGGNGYQGGRKDTSF